MLFNTIFSTLNPAEKLKSPSLGGAVFWTSTVAPLFVKLFFLVGITFFYTGSPRIECVPINGTTALKDYTNAECWNNLIRTNWAGSVGRDQAPLILTIKTLSASLISMASTHLGIIWFWQAKECGRFEFMMNGEDTQLTRKDKRRNRRENNVTPGNMYSWVIKTATKTVQRKKSFIGSKLIKHREFHKIYVRYYLVCEVLCFFNAIGHIFFMQWVTNGQFIFLGSKLFQYYVKGVGTENPLLDVFPTRIECHLKPLVFDVKGHLGYKTACIMTMNVYDEMVAVSLHFFVMFVAIVTFFRLVYRVLMICRWLRTRRLIWKWSERIDRDLARKFLDKTSMYEHILVDAIYRYADIDKFTNILLHVVEEMPQPVDMRLLRMRQVILGRPF